MTLDTNQVVVYGTQGCNPCKLTKKYLDRNGVEYEYRDISEEENLNAVKSLGYQSVPVVVTPGSHFGGGYSPDRLAELAR